MPHHVVADAPHAVAVQPGAVVSKVIHRCSASSRNPERRAIGVEPLEPSPKGPHPPMPGPPS